MKPREGADTEQDRNALRQIPPVDSLLRREAIRALESRFGHRSVVQAVRQVLDHLRDKVSHDATADAGIEGLETEIVRALEAAAEPSLHRVINATGVVLHTNLGRAPLAQEALERVLAIGSAYSNLEFDVDAGIRGKRDTHTEGLFRELLGAESTLVVNNNAAGLFLTLNTLAEGYEVVVSRGELVEIGGSFRIPEICSKSGCTMREVGTTNRTRISDYEQAINAQTRVILRVHPSNFRIVGFTERPEIENLARLAASHGVTLVEDLGSGCVADLGLWGLPDEPTVGKSLTAGVDIVAFSGDKLLGGPQSGILLGKRELLARVRRNPLFRILRVDKITVAALQATVALYLREDLRKIPAQRMIRTPKQEITVRAQALAQRLAGVPGLSVTLEDGESMAGGGSAPGHSLPTTLVCVTHSARSSQQLAQWLRRTRPPVITRAEQDAVLLDLRTVLDGEDDKIVEAFGLLPG
jgi:L-seryl-tRNA(Ser) seleniumtransferase